MFEADLFLGFPIDPLFEAELSKANPKILEAFMQGGEEYLNEFSYKGMRFLGKGLGSMISLSELELIEKNIYSLLKKVVSQFPYEEVPLYLFPIEHARS